MTTLKQYQLKRRLNEAIKPYAGQLDQWIDSELCFLSRAELFLIAYGTSFANPTPAAENLACKEDVVVSLTTQLCHRLERNVGFYQLFTKGEQVELVTSVLTKDLGSVVPKPMAMILRPLAPDLKTLLLAYSSADLIELKNFGGKKLLLLRELLEEHGCRELLI